MAPDVSLQPVDYIVTLVMLLIPLGIGILFAVRDAHRATRDEYLLGGRRMSIIPVALSLFATFASAIALIGTPSEVYYSGPMQPTLLIGFALSYIVGCFTAIPLLYPLRLTSVYEYLQLRFDSSLLRMSVVVIGMLQTILYMAIALLTPALSLQAAAGIPLWVSVLIIGTVGTVYTAIGGIKSVVWTDVFQTLVMFAGIFVMITKGVMTVGGVSSVWSIADKGGRTSFRSFSPDPRSRHTWWGVIIGGMTMWLGNIFNQSTVQRIYAMKSINDARLSFVVNACITLTNMVLLFSVGIVIYAYFSHIRCDPYNGGLITNRNQLPPYFVLHTLRDFPGISGIYMSTLFSASLSTLSSGINALAANTVEDFLQRPLKKVKESRATLITKLFVCFYGVLIIGLAYLADHLKGPVSQMALSVIGACGGPILGIFLLGASVPCGNKCGALIGSLTAISFNIWIVMGHQFYGKKTPLLPSPSTEMCFNNGTVLNDALYVTTAALRNTTSSYFTPLNGRGDGYGFFLYDISYEWYGLTGCFVSLTLGAGVSYLTKNCCKGTTNPELVFPFLRKFWSF
ncbi:unnamed protein product, partial [Lymnaea stagnalis]